MPNQPQDQSRRSKRSIRKPDQPQAQSRREKGAIRKPDQPPHQRRRSKEVTIMICEDSDEDQAVLRECDVISNLRKLGERDLKQEKLTRAIYRVIAGGKRKATKVENLKKAVISLVHGIGQPFNNVA